MGSEFASWGKDVAVGKQTLGGSEHDFCAPGKSTLTDGLASSPASELERVIAHAGQKVVDKGRCEYIALADGSFRIEVSPVPYVDAKGARITLAERPGAWGILYDLLVATAPAPATPTVNKKGPQRINGSTLEIAKTRADLGNVDTHYKRKKASDVEVRAMVKGDPKAATFWCSGFSMWTLAAAGYSLDMEVKGTDGKPFTYTGVSSSKDPATVAARRKNAVMMKQIADANIKLADNQFPVTCTITLRGLIDGWGLPVMLMAKIDREKLEKSCWLGAYVEEGNLFAGLLGGKDGDQRAATGAAGAFEALGIGKHVPEAEQKPGDFGQERWPVNGQHTGAGHAFQVWSVKAKGNAIFGEKRSPLTEDKSLKGWVERVPFQITKDTDPNLVGEHVVTAVERIEANKECAFPEDKRTTDKTEKGDDEGEIGDGGVQIKGEQPVPNVNKNHAGTKIFLGRLGESPWSAWKPATKPAG